MDSAGNLDIKTKKNPRKDLWSSPTTTECESEKSLMIMEDPEAVITLFAGMKRVFDEKWVESEEGHTHLDHCWKTGMEEAVPTHSYSGKCHLSLQ